MRFRLPPFGGLFGGTSEIELDPPEPLWRSEPALQFETRPNDDGTIDEVLIYVGGRCVFHLEQEADDGYWFAWYGAEDLPDFSNERHFHIWRRRKRVEITER